MVKFPPASSEKGEESRAKRPSVAWHAACSACCAMIDARRYIIVRRGDKELFDRLRTRFADDPQTVVRYDRRTGVRRSARAPLVVERRRGERRLPHDVDRILATRGYFVIRGARLGLSPA
jgi:hypothetical protein